MLKENLIPRIIAAFLCTASSLWAAQAPGYGGNFNTVISQLDDEDNTSFQLTKLTFACDILLSNYEFTYLTGLKVDSFITKRAVNQAYRQLMSKKRFSSISIDATDMGAGKHLHFTLTANWIFKKLEFEGVWFGKSQYASLYLQQPGDIFDAGIHEDSLKEIQHYLHDLGFLTCKVTDQLSYEKKYKVISAKIKIRKQHRFMINNVQVHIVDLTEQRNAEKNSCVDKLFAAITSKIQSPLMQSYYSKALIQKQAKKIKDILQKEGFVNARIKLTKEINNAKHTLALVFNIELGKRKILTFTGNTIFSDEFIKEQVIGQDLPDWLFSPDIIAQNLLHEYYKKGYWHSRVKPTSLGGSIGYNFMIKEGNPIIIRRVDISDAQTHLPEKTAVFLNDLLKNKCCDQNVLDQSLDQLKNVYISSGFWDFKIIEKRFIKGKKTGLYRIKITTDKGRQRLWHGFEIKGFGQLETSDFFKKYKLCVKNQRIPFNFYWLQEQRLHLIGHFQNLGYWYVDVQPELIVLPGRQGELDNPAAPIKIFVQWNIKQGRQVKFGKAIMRGSTTIPFKRLEKQFQFKEGDLWKREKLELTRKKLKRLDVFKTVQVQPLQLSKNKSKKPVIITVVDDDPLELRGRLGYFLTSKNFIFKRQSTPKVGGSFIVKNPTNRADRLALEGDWTKFERKFTLDYQQPSPFGLSALSKIKGFANKFVHPVEIAQSGSAYEALQTGFLFGLSDEYKETYYWGVNVGNEWLKITRVRGNLNFDPSLVDKTLPYFFVEPSLTIDKLDSRVKTTHGSLTSMSLKFMLPEHNGEVTAKFFGEQSLFYPIYHNIILAGRLRLGHIFGRKFEQILPIERFYLGGPYSVRGYELDALPPLGISQRIVDGNVVRDLTIQGGRSMVNANAELRFPIYKALGGVLFQDVGVLSQSGFLGLKDRWYPGSGFGIRYKTPIGALRFDIGWKWKRRIKEDLKSYTWYLTIGEAF